MFKYTALCVCALILLVQNVSSQCINQLNPVNSYGVPINAASNSLINNANCVNNGFGGNTAFPGFGGTGIGELAILGDLPVNGQTIINGNLPVIGIVQFDGCVPATGIVSLAGNSQGPCSCNSNYPY